MFTMFDKCYTKEIQNISIQDKVNNTSASLYLFYVSWDHRGIASDCKHDGWGFDSHYGRMNQFQFLAPIRKCHRARKIWIRRIEYGDTNVNRESQSFLYLPAICGLGCSAEYKIIISTKAKTARRWVPPLNTQCLKRSTEKEGRDKMENVVSALPCTGYNVKLKKKLE